MQLDLQASGGADDDDFNTVELTIIPAAPTTESTPALFAAISACAELHPDPADADDDDDDEDRIVFESAAGFEPGSGIFRGASDGGMPPAMPGSSGWITADNVNEFFDEDGNWIGGEEYDAEEGISGELGEGAGRVRGRDEVSGAEQPAAANGQEGRNGQQNGAEGEDSESKRQRTD